MKKDRFGRNIFLMIFISILIINCNIMSTHAEDSSHYDEIYFDGDEQELEEIKHLLFAKLAYDYLDDYEGKTVSEYVMAEPDLYSGEIWKDSGITYEAMYSSLVGEWEIYKVVNHNTTTGFYSVAFKSDNKVILAFRGSEMFTDEFALDESNDWTGTDLRFAVFNELSMQFDDADSSYLGLCKMLEKDGISADITFAGHSLGGALVTYESLVSGVYGYAFDGASGHVIDLVYYYNFLDIDNFSGIDNIRFCNYTDIQGYSVADLIQHTNYNAMYQIDRETELNNLNENTLIPKISTAGSHIIWSCLNHEENVVSFNKKADSDNTEYTYVPEGSVCLDINRNIIEMGIEELHQLTGDYEGLLGSLFGVVKAGRVMLADSDGDIMRAYDGIGVSSAFQINAVMYGGSGSDELYGYVGDDVLIAGEAENGEVSDYLDGGLGNDMYIIDGSTSGSVLVTDTGGKETTIILRNMDVRTLSDINISAQGIIQIGGNGKTISLNAAQSHENINIYTYNDGKLNLLGNLADVSGHEKILSLVYGDKYVVILEGEGSFDIYDGENLIGSFSNTNHDNKVIYNDYGTIYVNSDDGSESILMLLNNEYKINVSNNNARVNLAIGIYDNENGMVACERKYRRNFDNYKVLFSASSLDDGEQGKMSWEDALNAGVGFLGGIFNK